MQIKDKLASHDAAAKRAVQTLQNELKKRVDEVGSDRQADSLPKTSSVTDFFRVPCTRACAHTLEHNSREVPQLSSVDIYVDVDMGFQRLVCEICIFTTLSFLDNYTKTVTKNVFVPRPIAGDKAVRRDEEGKRRDGDEVRNGRAKEVRCRSDRVRLGGG